VPQPFSNHNGGQLQFGPDGMLYIGMGDGGAGGDPQGHGQNSATLLGAMLRIDVTGGDPYRIPPDNPFAGGGGRPEIWATGMRNPWKFTFDGDDLYIGDVGQDQREELNLVNASTSAGANFGWRVLEGTRCTNLGGGEACDSTTFTPPIVEYDHDTGCSITGGFVYRGRAIPALDGVYFYADYCTGLLRSMRWTNGRVSDLWDWKPVLDPDSKLATLSSFGEDLDGELYLISLDGVIWKLVPAE
jgi:glucose/arabinose dehydrogenase